MRMPNSRSQDASNEGRCSIHSRPRSPSAWETFSTKASGSFMRWGRVSPAPGQRARGAPTSIKLHALELTVRAPVLEDLHERHRTAAVWPVLPAPLPRLAFIVVVPRRARLEELTPRPRQADNRLDPLRLRFFRHLDRSDLM